MNKALTRLPYVLGLQRVLFELGLLTVKRENGLDKYPHNSMLLVPANAAVFERTLRVLLRTPPQDVFPTPKKYTQHGNMVPPPQQIVEHVLTPEVLQAMMDTTAGEMTNIYRLDEEPCTLPIYGMRGDPEMCEGTLRDHVYCNMLSALLPTRTAPYTVEKDWTVVRGDRSECLSMMVYDGDVSYHMFQTALENQKDTLLDEAELKAALARAGATAAQTLDDCFVTARDGYLWSDRFYRWSVAGVWHCVRDEYGGHYPKMSIEINLCAEGTMADEEKRAEDTHVS